MYGDGMDTNGDGKVDQNDDPYSPYYPGRPPHRPYTLLLPHEPCP